MSDAERAQYFDRAAAFCWLAIAFVGAFWLQLVYDGVSQHYFQSFQPIEEYVATLQRSVDGLRASAFIDNHFIVAYTCASFFFLMAHSAPGNGALISFSLSCYLLAGLIDLGEGMLYLTMSDASGANVLPSETLVFWFAWAATLKWHFAYIGLFLLTFVISPTSIAAWALTWIGRLVVLPVGIAVYSVGPELKPKLLLARVGVVIVGYLLMAIIAHQRAAELRKGVSRQAGQLS